MFRANISHDVSRRLSYTGSAIALLVRESNYCYEAMYIVQQKCQIMLSLLEF